MPFYLLHKLIATQHQQGESRQMIRKLSSVFMGRRKPLFVPYEIHLHNNMILVLNPAHMALSVSQ